MRSRAMKTPADSPGTSVLSYDAAAASMNNDFGRKLKEARKQKKLSQTELARSLESCNLRIAPTAVSKWELGESLPNLYTLFALCHILGIQDVLSFFTGKSTVTDSDVPALNALGMAKVHEYILDLAASGRYSVPRPAPAQTEAEAACDETPVVSIKIYDLPVSAGTGSFLDSSDFTLTDVPAASVPQGADFGVRVSGDSMLPSYRDQQIVWVRQCSSLHSGDIGIFYYDGDAYIKQFDKRRPEPEEAEHYTDDTGQVWDKVSLISLNTAYKPIVINPEREFRIFGRVLN